MRLTDDESLAWAVVTAVGQTTTALAAVGKLIHHSGAHLAPRSPLVAWCVGGTPDPDWRALVGNAPGSLWEQYELATTFTGAGGSAGVSLGGAAEARRVPPRALLDQLWASEALLDVQLAVEAPTPT